MNLPLQSIRKIHIHTRVRVGLLLVCHSAALRSK